MIGKKGLNMENNDIVFIKDFSNYGNKIMTHAEKQASKSLIYNNCNKLSLIDESSSKWTRLKTKRFSDIIFVVPTLECFSEVSSESVNYEDGQDAISEKNSVTVEFEDDRENIILKDQDSYENISSLHSFHIYVGEFKLNHENEYLINKTLSTTMLFNIISVSFNSNNENSNVINISKYLKFVKLEKKNQIINSSVKGKKSLPRGNVKNIF